MWIVRLALRRKYTVAVGAAFIFIFGILSLKSMLVDIFPAIDIPVVGVVWSYPGLSAEEMERRVVLLSERSLSTTVSGITGIESESIPGVGLLRVAFERGTDSGGAIAQIAAASATVLRSMPPGMTPPSIMKFNASNVPVAQLTVSSDSLPEDKLYDYAMNFIKVKLLTIPGLSTPAPYGGKARQINVDVDPARLWAKGLSSQDVVAGLQTSNLILPAGSARIGSKEFNILLNSSPLSVEEFEKLPIKVVNGAPITLGDVSHVVDGFADQVNIVRVNGKRATYLSIIKKADASTLSVVNETKKAIPQIQETAPEGMRLKLDFDQSSFVRSAITNVVREAFLASVLVSLMILFFLGSWRSVIIVCTSIPLAVLCGIIGLKAFGNSINIMTLGGLSLAIGMLVDDATVEIENIHRNRVLGLPLTVAILTGAKQVALPAIMATLAICIVFFPVVLLTGPARYLFTPLAEAVVFSMLASYVLSRTLVPLLSRMLMEGEKVESETGSDAFRHRVFARLEGIYSGALEFALANRKFVLLCFFALIAISLLVPGLVGRDFFPPTDTGMMKLHFRAASGTRIEETEKEIEGVETIIRKIIPANEVEAINSMIGVPSTVFNLALIPTENVGGMDGEILVALNEGHRPTEIYRKRIRTELEDAFPGSTFFFQPADIVNQVLNFGLSAPIDVQIEGSDLNRSYTIAKQLRDEIRTIPGAVDVNIKQVFDAPSLQIAVDRIRASEVGVTQRDVANSLIISLASSALVAPSYFLNPQNNVNYSVAVKVPLDKEDSVERVMSTPVAFSAGGRGPVSPFAEVPQTQTEPLANLATLSTQTTLGEINHSNVQRVVNITANAEGRDLGTVVDRIRQRIRELPALPKGTKIHVRGQGEVMDEAFFNLGMGLCLAILLVYLLMVVLFQSWLDPFIVLIAVPGALIGILWMLLLTGTTVNVTSFMGAIMAVGIAASNSVLLVSFANELRVTEFLDPLKAALLAGKTRLRPVLMTALAMTLGMLPAAFGMGEGGEQNAPLARAVIGGLAVATLVTLIVVPVVYSLIRTKMPAAHLMDEELRAEEEAK